MAQRTEDSYELIVLVVTLFSWHIGEVLMFRATTPGQIVAKIPIDLILQVSMYFALG